MESSQYKTKRRVFIVIPKEIFLLQKVLFKAKKCFVV